MSRSYRKNPIIKIKSRFSQKQAARRCRKRKTYMIDGCYYKKMYPQWDVCDYWTRSTIKRYSRWHPIGKEEIDYFYTLVELEPHLFGEICLDRHSFTEGFHKIEHLRFNKSEKEVSKKVERKIYKTYKYLTEEEQEKMKAEWKKEILKK